VGVPALELLEWIVARERTYEDVLEAWRSNCPRFAVWDDAVTDGLVTLERNDGRSAVRLTARGREVLEAQRRAERWRT
jgi:hypothetical protein